ncbi:MAG: Transcriptional regulator, TetR family protein [Myxococcales bacterium]|nr:Transcriptional regulator, TetR family protein [Myxococcales bacterium]
MSYMRSEARQRQILTCAKRVFAERGFHSANVSHICEAAGIGRGTLYQYFANKRSLLTAILRETLERVRTLMEQQSQAVAYPPPEQISRSAALAVSTKQLRRVLDIVFDDDDTLRILLREAVGLDVEIEKILGEIDEALIGIVERDLRRAHTAGYIRDLDARAVATMLVGGIEKLGLAALRSASPVDLDALAREATKLHSLGIFSDRLKPD